MHCCPKGAAVHVDRVGLHVGEIGGRTQKAGMLQDGGIRKETDDVGGGDLKSTYYK